MRVLVFGLLISILFLQACENGIPRVNEELPAQINTITRQPTITHTLGITTTPTLLHVPTLRPFRTNYRIPTNSPTTSRTSTPYSGTPTNTPFPIALNENTILPTSTYQLNPTHFPEDRFYSRCLDSAVRMQAVLSSIHEMDDYFSLFDPYSGFFIRQASSFDPNVYFNILTHIHMVEGYSLDFVFDGLYCEHGHAELYARPVGGHQYNNIEDLMELTGETDVTAALEALGHLGDNYNEYIVGDDTPEAFFQLALLMLKGDNFLLAGTEGAGSDLVLCERYDLDRVLDYYHPFPEELFSALQELDTTPTVIMGDDVVEVRIVLFSVYTGVYEHRYWFSRSYPYLILDQRISTLMYFSRYEYMN